MGIGDGNMSTQRNSREVIQQATKAYDALAQDGAQAQLRDSEQQGLLQWEEQAGMLNRHLGATVESKSFRGPDTLVRIGAVVSLLRDQGVPESDVFVSYNPDVSVAVLEGRKPAEPIGQGERTEIGSVTIPYATLEKLKRLDHDQRHDTGKPMAF